MTSLFRNLTSPLCSPVMGYFCIVLENQSSGLLLHIRKCHTQRAAFSLVKSTEGLNLAVCLPSQQGSKQDFWNKGRRLGPQFVL